MRYVGATMDMQNDKGDIKTFRVSKIKDGKITLDCNHILAGKDLIFDVTIKEVRPPNALELANLPRQALMTNQSSLLNIAKAITQSKIILA